MWKDIAVVGEGRKQELQFLFWLHLRCMLELNDQNAQSVLMEKSSYSALSNIDSKFLFFLESIGVSDIARDLQKNCSTELKISSDIASLIQYLEFRLTCLILYFPYSEALKDLVVNYKLLFFHLSVKGGRDKSFQKVREALITQYDFDKNNYGIDELCRLENLTIQQNKI